MRETTSDLKRGTRVSERQGRVREKQPSREGDNERVSERHNV